MHGSVQPTARKKVINFWAAMVKLWEPHLPGWQQGGLRLCPSQRLRLYPGSARAAAWHAWEHRSARAESRQLLTMIIESKS